MLIDKKEIDKTLRHIALGAIEAVENVAGATKKVVDKSTEAIVDTLDANEDGNANIEDIIIAVLRTPGSHVDREEFLRKRFEPVCNKEILEKAIKKNPIKAGISMTDIDEIAEDVIKVERNFATGISATLGTQGGMLLTACVPADIIQYFVYTLRIVQKQLYLYGFPELDLKERKSGFNPATISLFTICLGVMYDVEGASDAIKVIAKLQASGAKKKEMKKALTEGIIENEVEDAAEWFEERMVPYFIYSSVKNMVPLFSGIICGEDTYRTIGKNSGQLKEVLKDTALSNPMHEESKEEKKIWKKLEQVINENKEMNKEEE